MLDYIRTNIIYQKKFVISRVKFGKNCQKNEASIFVYIHLIVSLDNKLTPTQEIDKLYDLDIDSRNTFIESSVRAVVIIFEVIGIMIILVTNDQDLAL